MKEMNEDLMQEVEDTQHILPQLLSSVHTTHTEYKFPSQPQQNPRSIPEVEVQDGNLSNMQEENS